MSRESSSSSIRWLLNIGLWQECDISFARSRTPTKRAHIEFASRLPWIVCGAISKYRLKLCILFSALTDHPGQTRRHIAVEHVAPALEASSPRRSPAQGMRTPDGRGSSPFHRSTLRPRAGIRARGAVVLGDCGAATQETVIG